MTIDWTLWFLFPSAVAISTVAMASGVGGAIFFSPLFILVLGLPPGVAIGTALMTELFGFSSGLFAYSRQKLIDYRLGRNVIAFSIPFALLGLYIGQRVSPDVLKSAFSVGILFIAYQIYSEWRKEEAHRAEADRQQEFNASHHATHHVDAAGKDYYYTVCNPGAGRFFASVGGLFVGMISVGLGELLDYHLVSRCKVPAPIAVGTAIFAVVVTVLVASVGHFYEFLFRSEPGVLEQVLGVVVFTIPGVLIGGQIGPRVQKAVPEDAVKVGLSVLFALVGLLMFYTLIQ